MRGRCAGSLPRLLRRRATRTARSAGAFSSDAACSAAEACSLSSSASCSWSSDRLSARRPKRWRWNWRMITRSRSVDLWSLDGSNGFNLSGVAEYDRSGRSVASAGDVNGDGFVDLIVGAPYADPHGSNSGPSYVVFAGPLE
jgi:hypothetical protein